MRAIISAALMCIALASGPIVTGNAYHYRATLFRQVAENRSMTLREDVTGYASVRNCSRIGQLVLARVGRVLGWFQIIDCSHPDHTELQDDLGLIIEVNYDVAVAGGWEWDYDKQRGIGHIDAAIYMFKPQEFKP